jgi:hypothetical protein
MTTRIKKVTYPACAWIYKWGLFLKNWIAIIGIVITAVVYVVDKFNKGISEVKTEIATLRAAEHYVDTDKIEHADLYAMCYKRDARIDTAEWDIGYLKGADSALTSIVTALDKRVFNLENK